MELNCKVLEVEANLDGVELHVLQQHHQSEATKLLHSEPGSLSVATLTRAQEALRRAVAFATLSEELSRRSRMMKVDQDVDEDMPM